MSKGPQLFCDATGTVYVPETFELHNLFPPNAQCCIWLFIYLFVYFKIEIVDTK